MPVTILPGPKMPAIYVESTGQKLHADVTSRNIPKVARNIPKDGNWIPETFCVGHPSFVVHTDFFIIW